MLAQPLLSVVIPVHNEQPNLGELYRRLAQTAPTLGDRAAVEFVFVDDGSTDDSLSVLRELAEEDERVVVVQLTRNWGSHAAIKAGLRAARGGCFVALSADLQDPPEILCDLYRAFRQGFDVVWGTRASRRDPLLKTLWSQMFYAVVRLVLPNLPPTGVDVFLISRSVLDELLSLGERNIPPYYQILWLGYPYAVVPYHRAARTAGVSKWSFHRRIRLAINTLITFTGAPLRLLTLAGCFLLGGTLLRELWRLWESWRQGAWAESGLGSLICFLSGLNLLGMGVIGEYLWRLVGDVRQRPEYCVQRVFKKSNEDSPPQPKSEQAA